MCLNSEPTLEAFIYSVSNANNHGKGLHYSIEKYIKKRKMGVVNDSSINNWTPASN